MPDDHDEAFRATWRAIHEPRERAADELLATVRARIAELRELAERIDRGFGAEDLVYRFWHHSFKVYGLQEHTLAIVALLEELTPEGSTGLDKWFKKIVKDSTGHEFELGHNQQWLRIPRRIVEAYFQAAGSSAWRSATARRTTRGRVVWGRGGRRCWSCTGSGEGG